MTRDDATAILDNISMNEAIPAAKAVEMLRAWKAGRIDVEAAIEVLGRLRPAEVIQLVETAERKLARRNRLR